MPDGRYRLGPQEVRIEAGVARLVDGDALAGGTSHLLDCVRVAVRDAGLTLEDAIYVASTGPAAAFGWSDRGAIEAGRRADLLALGADLDLVLVVRGGQAI